MKKPTYDELLQQLYNMTEMYNVMKERMEHSISSEIKLQKKIRTLTEQGLSDKQFNELLSKEREKIQRDYESRIEDAILMLQGKYEGF